jgi:hypothetical protein
MRRAFSLITVLLGGGLLGVGAAGAQEVEGAPSELEPLSVFLDCDRRTCDFDHFRREVDFINYARDRQDADVHVLVTTQNTGGGGREYTFAYIGLRDFVGREDTLRHVSRPEDTDAEVRDELVQTFQLGLVRYVADTPMGRLLEIEVAADLVNLGGVQQSIEDDPWNLWSFRARISSELEGESRQSSIGFDGSFRANRTTEALKIELGTRGDYERQEFELSDGSEIESTRRNYDVDGLIAWSLGDHWSFGAQGAVTAATRLNQDLAIRAGPALEYNIFPYAESTRKQLTFLYKVGMASFRYEEITLFDKTEETRPEHSLNVSASVNQPWGEVSGSFEASTYLDDWSKHRLDLSSRFEVRIVRGLSFDVRGSIARVKDQIYLPREDISDEDILLERRQLGTDFEYSLDIGLSFTFGSRFNNVVNPRMRMGGGGNNRFN